MSDNLPEVIEEQQGEPLPAGAMPFPTLPAPEGFGWIKPESYDFENCATRIDRMGPYAIEDVIAAIMATHGNLAAMAGLLGRSRARLKEYIYKTPEALELLQDMDSAILDNVEHGHTRLALSGDGPAQRFLLATKGKNRGYHKETTIVPPGQQDQSQNIQRINLVAPPMKTINHDDEDVDVVNDVEEAEWTDEPIEVDGSSDNQLGLFDE